MDAPVIALDHPAALDAARVGLEAAGLAAARAGGLPVLPGVVLTSDWSTHDRATAEQVWRITSHDGCRPLVVRPSEVVRRRPRGDDPCTTAPPAVAVHDVDELLRAAATWRAAGDGSAPLLLHPRVGAAWWGALFADGDAGRRTTSVVVARPATAAHDWIAILDDAGRVADVVSPAVAPLPPPRLLGRLTRLAERVTDLLGRPHDLEWAADADDRVRLDGIRPVVHLRVTDPPCPRRVDGQRWRRADVRSALGRPRSVERAPDSDRRVA